MKYLDGQEGDEYLDSGLGDPSHFIGDDPNIEDGKLKNERLGLLDVISGGHGADY